MPADGRFGMDADDRDHDGDLRPPADRSAKGIRQAETRDRIEYFEVLQAAEQRHRSEAGNPARAVDTQKSSAWDEVAAEDRASRPAPDSLNLSPERAVHILDGDRWGGGHRHGSGRPEKTEFPADWDDRRIADHITNVARTPDVTPVLQPNHRWRVSGVRDGVDISVIVQPDGQIWSAWPAEGSPGVTRNPKEG